ncbi:hypothetical protein IW140_004986 [Coemansia sp. RSA 1813]|nr:hypothetical protein EV178_005585 [Coemansia sp. RSA 1646]KAJ1768560.1 hypothetical protein LPJ74_004798 [Coemansia sp. RSA 1843]KAJ2085483.1 hypothetical protein IW138_006305 [Coemansia sp. RSA 986]KAJ2212999.1 hypothetical protein EV179_004227 [Coemansia sp. RSA 487]KAJ2566298.1 hypothetical protein IW140_004986 [Coemansia sp. RSA 1813]
MSSEQAKDTLEYHKPTDQPSNNTAHMVIVTRIGSWLGAETTLNLLKHGITVIGIGEREGRIGKLQTAIDHHEPWRDQFIPVIGQLSDPLVHDSVIQHIEANKDQKKLAALVINIGAYEGLHIGGKSIPPFEQWTELQRSLIEAMPLFHSIRHILRKYRCRVVNVASIDEIHNHLPRHVSLIAIKTAVNMMTAEVAVIEPRLTSLAVHPSFSALQMALEPPGEKKQKEQTQEETDRTASVQYTNSPDHLKPASDLIVDLAINADRSASGKFFMYSETSFP